MARSSSLSFFTLLALVCMTGCTNGEGKLTQLLVVVNTDLTPGVELEHFVLNVTGQAEQTARPLSDGVMASGQARTVAIPFSFGVKPGAGGPGAAVTIEVVAVSPAGEKVGVARAHVAFVVGLVKLVPLNITRSCLLVFASCSAEETCRDGTCGSFEVDVSSLSSTQPGHELEGLPPLSVCPGGCASVGLDSGVGSLLDSGLDGGSSAETGRPPESLVVEPALPERPQCGQNSGYFVDVDRTLTRSADGEQCPAVTQGDQWGSSAGTRTDNLMGLHAYLQRCLDAQADVIGLDTSFVEGELVTHGFFPNELKTADNLPTLREALAVAELRTAEQPVAVTLNEPALDSDALVEALLDVVRDASILRRCRPLYLTAMGPTSFQALRSFRRRLAATPELAQQWPLVHFIRTLDARGTGNAAGDVEQALAGGFDMIRLDLQREELPLLLAHIHHRGAAVSLYNALNSEMASTMCGLSDSVERLVKTDRPDFLRHLDDQRASTQLSRVLLSLDARAAPLDATQVAYRGLASAPGPYIVAAGDGTGPLPSLTQPLADPTLQTGTFLHFDAAKGQSVALGNADNAMQLPEGGYFSYPKLSVALIVRFGRSLLMPGERQVVISKQGPDSGWALELTNLGKGTVLHFLHHGMTIDTQVPYLGEVSLPAESTGISDGSVRLVVLQALGAFMDIQVAKSHAENATTSNMGGVQATMVHNDLPVTLGADADGGTGFFAGEIQAVRITSVY